MRSKTVLLCLALAASKLALAGGSLELGTPLPASDAKLQNVDGRELTLASVKGANGTLVVFTCNQCPFAKAWETRIAALGNEFAGRGIGVIAINANDPGVVPGDSFDEMKKRSEALGLKFPYAMDATSNVARAFMAARTPEAFLFDKSGKLVYHGRIDDNAEKPDEVKEHYLRDALVAVVEGKEPAVKETKALGCGIKFRS